MAPRSSESGAVPVIPTSKTAAKPAARSNGASTAMVEPMVVRLEPRISARARASLAASPPRAGTTALSATPVA
jgi:hypothetical protein